MEFHDRKEMSFTISAVQSRIIIRQDQPDRVVHIVDFFHQEYNNEYVHEVAARSSVVSLLSCAEIVERLLHFEVKNYLPAEKGQEKELEIIKDLIQPFRGVMAEFVRWEKEKYAIRVIQSFLAEKKMRRFAPLIMELVTALKNCPWPADDANPQVIEMFNKNITYVVQHYFEGIMIMIKNLVGFTTIGGELEEERKTKRHG